MKVLGRWKTHVARILRRHVGLVWWLLSCDQGEQREHGEAKDEAHHEEVGCHGTSDAILALLCLHSGMFLDLFIFVSERRKLHIQCRPQQQAAFQPE